MGNAKLYIAGAGTYNVFSGPGTLKKIILTETAAGTITVYDETSGGTTDIATLLKASIVEDTYEFDIAMGKGCQIVVAAGSKMTVVYSRG